MSEKLVRDRIPDIIRADGRECGCRIAGPEEYRSLLIAKLDEEVAEFKESGSLEELGDVMEVLVALAKEGGWSEEDLLAENRRKRDERGGFDGMIVLVL